MRRAEAGIACATLAAICCLSTAPALAADATETDQRIEELERQNAEIRDEIERLKEHAQQEPQARTSAPVDAEDGLFTVKSKVPITLTGFLKGDMLWNAPRLNSTSAPRFAASDPGHGGDDQFTGTVQHSRLIARLGKVDLTSDTSAFAHVELDFFNLSDTGDTNFNNNQLRVRQLFAQVDHERWTVLAGQAWDLFSPLNPATLNTNGNFWFGGNGGFRRPQLRVVRSIGVGESTLEVAGSVNANVGVTVTDMGRTLDSGRDSGIPVLEGAVQYAFPGLADAVKVGVSGLWGQEDVDGVENNIEQWAVGAHAVIPLAGWLSLSGEYQLGENTDAFLMGGGINTTTGRGIWSQGGWAQATLGPWKRLTLNVLFGANDIEREDLAAGALKHNRVAGANLRFQVFEPLTVGVEYDHFDSDFRGAEDEKAEMLWASAILSF